MWWWDQATRRSLNSRRAGRTRVASCGSWPEDLGLVAERMHCGVWTNSIDARAGSSLAVALGWRRVPSRRPLLRHGSRRLVRQGALAVCDSGSLDVRRSDGVDPPVIHRVSPEHTMRQPLGAKTRPAFGCHRTSPTRRPSPEPQAELLPVERHSSKLRLRKGTVTVLGQPRRPRCRGPSRQRAPCCRHIQRGRRQHRRK